MKLSKLIYAKLAALLVSSAVYAASDMETRVSLLEKQMKEVRTETALDTNGALTASARADVDGRGWSVLLGPVYYFPRVGGTEFCYTDDDPTAGFPIKGRVKNMNFKWDWGLRAGIGYGFTHDAWDIFLGYLWFSSSGSKSVDSGLNGSLIPLKGASAIVANCSGFNNESQFVFSTSAKSQYEFNHHEIDLELGRDYFVSKYFAVRPHYGLRAAYFLLQQVTRYTGGSTALIPNNAGLDVNTVAIKEETKSWGLGPRAGMDARFFLGSGFSIYGTASAALIYSRLDVDHSEKFSLCSPVNRIKLSANEHRFVPNSQFMLGLRYDRYFDTYKQAIAVRLGYDAQYFWRANQALVVNDDFRDASPAVKYTRVSEDVSYQGLMLDGRWYF